MSSAPPLSATEVLRTARELRGNGNIHASYELVCSRSPGADPGTDLLVWQHQPLFWDEIAGGNCRLTRRNGADAAFIRELWSERDFARRFHRTAVRLPARPGELERILDSEFVSLITDQHSLHWVVRDKQGTPWGVLSLTNIAIGHRRAEVLLGVKNGAPFGLAPAAMLLLFRFFFGALKFRKLHTLTFDDNDHSFKGVQHLGFVQEGRLRQHICDPATGKFVDVVQSGLLAEEAFSAGNLRMMKRLALD